MSQWQVLPGADPLAAERFADLDAVFALEGEIVAKDSTTRTVRVEVDGRRYYVKRYHGLGKKPLKRLLARPRVQLEWENLQRFADWGIPTARLVACGLERQGGRFVRGALITAEIPGTTDLGRLARAHDPRLKSQSWRDGVSTQVADIARRLHGRRFVHGDLKWRNLLVDAAGKVFLIDCPSGGFWWPPFLQYRIVKDLACLDKVAKRQLSRTRRLRFYLDYAQKKKLDDADKRRIRQIAGFFTGRDEAQESAASLRAGGRRVLAPSTVALDDGSELVVERWLRILPGKRLTGIGQWNGQAVLAKLFVAARGDERHWQREWRGIDSLQAHGLPTPKRLASGRLEGAGHYVLTEYLDGARCPDAAAAGELASVFETVGRMHARGILQEDVHLGNFLLHADKLYVVDGDAIRPDASERERLDNLALLFAQLAPAACRAMQVGLLAAYRKGNPGLTVDAAQLEAEAAVLRERQAAAAAAAAKSSIIQRMNDELRTPMSALVGAAEHLRRAAQSPQARAHIATLLQASEVLRLVLNDLSDLDRLENGQLKIEPRPANPRDLLRGVISAFRAAAQDKNLELFVDVDPAMPALLEIDALRVRQVLFNLLANAVRYTTHGGVRVSMSAQPIDAARVRLNIVVADTGAGMSRSQLALIFGRERLCADGEGPGIGLAISLRLAKLMGGKITAKSELGEGSVFSFVLDAQIAAARASSAA